MFAILFPKWIGFSLNSQLESGQKPATREVMEDIYPEILRWF